jgi:hypothetical protein
MSASRSDSRATTTAAGSSSGGAIHASGNGSSHETSPGAAEPGTRSGSSHGPASPDGSTRIRRRSNADRQTLVAILYSQDRIDARRSNPE